MWEFIGLIKKEYAKQIYIIWFCLLLIAYFCNAAISDFTNPYFFIVSVSFLFAGVLGYNDNWYSKVIITSLLYNLVDELTCNACNLSEIEVIGFILLVIYYKWKQ